MITPALSVPRRGPRLAGVLWALAAMVGAATYFIISADDDNGLPPMALAAGGLIAGAAVIAAMGLVGLMPMRTSTASVEYAGQTVDWWAPLVLLGVDRGSSVHHRDRRDPAPRLPVGVVRGAARGGRERAVRLVAARSAAAAHPAGRRRADPRGGRA